MVDSATLHDRRVTGFDQFWEDHRSDWEPLTVEARDVVWTLARLAWYRDQQGIDRTDMP